ncbi:MAG: mechanosensitive ion channel [Lachnospiraceae bacterium]|nr:mechanosensitive ion channel [Lachnospiraceae bacterium]
MDSAIITAVIIAAATLILQKTLGNLVSGLVLIITRPFKKGDKIIIKNEKGELVSGKVVSMSLLYVKIQVYNRDVMIIPTSLMDQFTVVNSDYKQGVNHTEYFRFSPESDHRKAVAIIREVLLNDERTQNTAENTDVICRFDNGLIIIHYNVRTESVDKSFEVCSDICETLLERFKKEDNITIK